MKTSMTENKKLVSRILAIILIVAFLFRLSGLFWGLTMFDRSVKEPNYHPDEYKIVLPAQNLINDIRTREDLRYPTGMHYLVGVLALPLNLFRNYFTESLYIDLLYILGRSISLVYGVLSIYFTFLLSKKISNYKTGLIAASLLTVSVYHVRNSSVATTDVGISFWLCVFLLLAEKIDVKSRLMDYVLLGASLGLLVGTKYTGAVALIPACILFGRLILTTANSLDRLKILKFLVFAAGIGLLIFLLTTPVILLHPNYLLQSLAYEMSRIKSNQIAATYSSLIVQFLVSLASSSNIFILILFLLASIWILIEKRRNISLIAIIVLVAVFFCFFGNAFSYRYWILLLPLICIVAAYGLERGFASQNPLIRISANITLILCFAYGVLQIYQLSMLLLNDTRSRAANYIQQTPPKTRVSLGFDFDPSKGWQYPSARRKRVEINMHPDLIILSQYSDDILQGSFIEVYANGTKYEYRLAKVFEPSNRLQVEFLSPKILIYELNP